MRSVQVIYFLSALLGGAAGSYAQEIDLFIGTSAQGEKRGGLHVYRFDPASGKVTFKNMTSDITDPLCVVISNDQKHVYAVHNIAGKGMVSAFSFDKQSGMLSLLNQKSSTGPEPVFVTIDKQDKHILVANYNGANWAVLPVLKDGSLQDAIQSIKYNYADTGRRRQVHVHCAYLSPDERFVFISDLTNDRIIAYPYSGNAAAPADTTKPRITQLAKGNGPRLFVFHPNKQFAYSIQEISSEIVAFSYQHDTLANIQHISTLEPGYTGRKWPSEIHISPDGKFLYAANRDPVNDIAIFAIQPDGKLVAAGRQPVLGKTPRSFAIDPTGNYLLAANQASHNITIFKRDKNTGQLTDTGQVIELGSPVFVLFGKTNK